jgi:hypothetical protein
VAEVTDVWLTDRGMPAFFSCMVAAVDARLAYLNPILDNR